MARPGPSRSSAVFTTVAVLGEAVGLLLQLLLVWAGVEIVWGGGADENDLALRWIWCLVAAAYLGFTLIHLNILVRADRPDPHITRVLIGHPITRALSTLVGLGASAIGLTVAIELIFDLGTGRAAPLSVLSAVCAMLLSWAMFNWGYARIFFSHYHRAPVPPLEFPGTAEPRLVDFVYLSFTNATTFAVSDVKVLTTRMRWTVVWHTSIAFFFNALIIALTLNVIMNGTLFAGMFG